MSGKADEGLLYISKHVQSCIISQHNIYAANIAALHMVEQ